MGYCNRCNITRKELLKTAYGYYLCEDCWDDYICTDEGRVEYLIGICRGDYPMSDFDADFLGAVAQSWNDHSHQLDLPVAERTKLTYKAYTLGLIPFKYFLEANK